MVFCVLTGFLLGYLVVGNIQHHPRVASSPELNAQQLRKIRRLVNRNHPFRNHTLSSAESNQPSRSVTSRLTEDELNLLLKYVLKTRQHALAARSSSQIGLFDDEARIQLSIELPDNPIAEYFDPGRFINLSLTIKSYQQNDAHIRPTNFMFGELNIPDGLTRFLLARLDEKLKTQSHEYTEVVSAIEFVKFEPRQLKVKYRWQSQDQASIKASLGSMVISAELKQALMLYYELLAEYSQTLPENVELNQLLRAMFFMAQQQGEEMSPVLENQAILINLAAYIMKRNIPRLLGEKASIKPRHRRVYLKGRQDLSQHFIISAAIASLSDSALAEAIGLEKEIYDAQGGSGFSYADLAADYAGIEMAALAMGSDLGAVKLQKFMAYSDSEENFMPDIKQLPEGIRSQALKNELGDRNSPAARQLKNDIMQSIKKLPVYTQQ